MNDEITYDINLVIGKLSAKIADLEVQLAHVQSVNEAYAQRFEEIKKEGDQTEK